FQMPSPLPSLNQWSQSYTPSAACQCVCRLCGSLLFEAFAMYGPSLAGCVMRAYTTSATPTMRMRAVSPYHQLLLRARFADRTAARLRFFGVAFAIEREDYPRVRGGLAARRACSDIARAARNARYTAANGSTTARTPVKR